ncbi:MAG: hypothetical protein Aurels2KO_40480 [Aureliella sp.]
MVVRRIAVAKLLLNAASQHLHHLAAVERSFSVDVTSAADATSAADVKVYSLACVLARILAVALQNQLAANQLLAVVAKLLHLAAVAKLHLAAADAKLNQLVADAVLLFLAADAHQLLAVADAVFQLHAAHVLLVALL